ncbi:hypothetical protein GCM10023231_36630 [Olivibacter ginsenosidimutans]|uniref:DUF4890 domain-containing protein n=2 Tax=Olivibacter ginsenosidimutans TaxID=1176537 RepID=A0ABP9C696_9SPHI
MSKAQQGRGGMRMKPEDRAKHSVDLLNEKLTLTQEQKDSVYQFSLAEAKEQQALFQAGNNGGDRKANFEKMRSIREKTQQKIKGILTDEQQKAYDELVKEQRNRMQGQGRGRGRQG